MDNTILILLLWASVMASIGAAIGGRKGRTGAGAFFGFLLGPIGWLIVGLGPSNKPKCPQCGGEVVEGAAKCKNCGSDIATETVQA